MINKPLEDMSLDELHEHADDQYRELCDMQNEFNSFDYWSDHEYELFEREIRSLKAYLAVIEDHITRRAEQAD